MKDWNKAEEHI